MDASSALHLLDDMDFSTVTTAAVGGWPSSSSTSDKDKVGGQTNNAAAPTTGLDDLYLQVQKHAYSEERSSSKQLEIARVVSNDDGDDSDDGSDDEIPDLTITQTKSFDEEENILQGTNARSLPAICEQDEDGVTPCAQSAPQSSSVHSDCIRSILYDEVRKTTERCVEMQKKLDDKDTELKEVSQNQFRSPTTRSYVVGYRRSRE